MVRVQENRRNLETLQIQNSDINSKLNNTIEKSEILNETSVIEEAIDKFDNRVYISSGNIPTHAPSKRKVKIGTDGHLYVGIGKFWYKSVKALTIINN